MNHSKKLFRVRTAQKGLTLFDVRIPENALYMRIDYNVYIYTLDIYAITNLSHFVGYKVSVEGDGKPQKITIYSDTKWGELFKDYAKNINFGYSLKCEIHKKDLVGLAPRFQKTASYIDLQRFATK